MVTLSSQWLDLLWTGVNKRLFYVAKLLNEVILEPLEADKLLHTASPLAEIYLMRPFHEYSGSKHSLDVAAGWVQTCCDEHEKCRNGPAPLPTRVLDVGSAGDLIRLMSGSGITGQYSCLSYCVSSTASYWTQRRKTV